MNRNSWGICTRRRATWQACRNEALEGLDENNTHRFHHALTSQLFNLTHVPTDRLLEYDENIVTHTLRLNERRTTCGQPPLVWKYFQYLT